MAISLGTGSLAPGQLAGFILPFSIDATAPIPLRVFYVFPTHPVPNIGGNPDTPPDVKWHVHEELDWMSFPTETTLGVSTTWIQRTQIGFAPFMNHFIVVCNFSSAPIEFEFFTNSETL
jgi:hypothetical protein